MGKGSGDVGQVLGNVTDAVGLTNYSGQDASRAQREATDQANQLQYQMFQQQRQDNEPWRASGIKALAGLESPDFQKSFSMTDYQQDPGYQFRLQEGMKAINSAAAARGMGNSGATLKALTRYGQDFASNEYQNAYNRFTNDQNNKFNRLSSLAGVGQVANQQIGNATANYGNNVSSNIIGMGNSYAANYMATPNRLAGAIESGGKAALAAAVASDVNLKENIKPISKEDLNEMKSILKGYHFNYINDKYGEGEWVGVMAQDLEKSKIGKELVFTDENGFKQIDLKKLLSMFLAYMAEA